MRRLGLALLLALGVPAGARAEQASDPAMAQTLFEAGCALMADGKVDEACSKFEASNKLDPSAGTLLNLGRCYEAQGKTASAWAAYKRAIGIARSTGHVRHLQAGEELSGSIEPRLSKLVVRAPTPVAGLSDLVEIFNASGSVASLAGIVLFARAPTEAEDHVRWMALDDETLPPYGHLLVAGAAFDDLGAMGMAVAADATFQDASLGDDVLVFLKQDGVVLDAVCVCAERCDEDGWEDCGAVLLQNPNARRASQMDRDVSLARRDPCTDSDLPTEFEEQPSTPMGRSSPPTPP